MNIIERWCVCVNGEGFCLEMQEKQWNLKWGVGAKKDGHDCFAFACKLEIVLK